MRTVLGTVAAASLMGCLGETRGGSSAGRVGPQEASCTSVPPAPLRRLSRAEYLATVRDLFPTVTLGELSIPRDSSAEGFENRADLLNPTPLLIEQYSAVAAEIAAKVIETPSAVLPCTPTAETEATCAARFIETFGEKAFRRPLAADETKTYADFLSAERAAGASFHGAVQLTLEAMLQAPPFLYRLELGEADPAAPATARLTSYEVASRMSYLLWGAPPDAALRDKARAGKLGSPEERAVEARRMLADARARDMLVEFHRQWLELDRLENEPKDATRFPIYTQAMKASIREESDRFVANVLWKGDGTLGSLLTSNETEVDEHLAELYGVPAPPSGWAGVALDGAQRSGILTRANFLASQAHRVAGSPPLRAVYVLRRFLCAEPPPPPPTANLSEPVPPTGDVKTNRQLFEERLAPSECSGCHATFTGLGYAFESFDAIGQYRTSDSGLPVDATSSFRHGALDWQLSGAVDLSEKLAKSQEVHACVASYWFEYAFGRAQEKGDACRVRSFADAFAVSGANVRELLVAFVKSPEFVVRPSVQP